MIPGNSIHEINCYEFEALLADYIDNTLDTTARGQVEAHVRNCAVCAEMARDAAQVTAFISRAAAVQPPPALVNRIVAEIENGPSRAAARPSFFERLLGHAAATVLAPRLAMGVAMTALSIGMFIQVTGAGNPAQLLSRTENKLLRMYDRAVKDYDNLSAINNLQVQLDDLRSATDTDINEDRRPGSDETSPARMDGK